MATAAAFSCVTDSDHFLGAVALLNSLRLVGHREPFAVVDCGLEPWQRAALEPHATIVAAPPGVAPMLLKPEAARAVPADVAVVLDADVIVTRPLDVLVDTARRGAIVVFANGDAGRHFAEWGLRFGIGPVRRGTYVASGHLAISPERHGWFLDFFRDCQRSLDAGETLLANRGALVRSTPADPFHYPDMDVLNALLMTVVPEEEVAVLDYRLAPHAPFAGIRLVDARTLACRYDDGLRPLVLHHILRKPWLAATAQNVYSQLLPRLLVASDVEVRLDRTRVPLRLRDGSFAAVDRTRADVQALAHARLRGKLGLRRRLAARRAAA